MELDSRKLKAALEARTGETVSLLTDIISIPSTRGNEGPVVRYLLDKLTPLADDCELVPISDDIQKDPDYSFPLENFTYADQPNLRLAWRPDAGIIRA